MARPKKFRLSPEDVGEPEHARKLAGHVSEIEFFRRQVVELQNQIAGIYDAADEDGFDKKFVRLAVGRRAKDADALAAQEEAVDAYAAAIEAGLSTRVREENPDHDPETGEILDTNTARETVASTTAADPAGEADDASSADQSTAALTEVPGTAPDHQDLRDIADAPRSYPPEPQQKAAEHASSGSVAGAPAGTQAPPVDTNSEPQGASIGAKPSMASEPATGEGTGPQPSSVVPGRQPGCLNPDTCAGTWRKRCASCERAFMAVAAGGQAIVHQGQVA
jgi:uncharacterized protein (UPF0335 family)